MQLRTFGTDPEFPFSIDIKDKLPMIIPPQSLIEDFGLDFTEDSNEKKQFLSTSHGSVIADGAAFEFNVKPSTTASALLFSIKSLERSFEMLMQEYSFDKESVEEFTGRLQYEVVGYFDLDKYWKNRGESFHECVIFGCDQDFQPELYTELGLDHISDKVIDVSAHELRYFGAHLHIMNMGEKNIYINNCEFAPVVCDFTIGLVNTALYRPNTIVEQEKLRLKYYGRPGRYRLQEYGGDTQGFEYRPLSNFWLKSKGTVEAILSIADVAGLIVEANLSPQFVDDFFIDIPVMWECLLDLDADKSINLLSKTIIWAIDNDIIPIKNIDALSQALKAVDIKLC